MTPSAIVLTLILPVEAEGLNIELRLLDPGGSGPHKAETSSRFPHEAGYPSGPC